MSYIAPAGTPLGLADLAAGLHAGLFRDDADALAAKLACMTATARCWLTVSGRAAITTALRAMRGSADEERVEVVVPGYTCYSVAAAVVRAGLRPRVCDIDPETLDYDGNALRELDTTRVLAIASSNLYGIPNDLTALELYAAKRDIYLIDDAAQALGATFAGRPVGGFGEAGILSFEKGKNITTMEGGAIVTRNGMLAQRLDAAHAALPKSSAASAVRAWLKLPVYAAFFRPSLYGLICRLPFLGLGKTVYDPTFELARYPRALAGLALHLSGRLEALSGRRNANAADMRTALEDLPGVKLVRPHPLAAPAYTRLPCLLEAPAHRARILAALDRAGIGASASYPRALCDVPEVRAVLPPSDRELSGARFVAASILTLPIHPLCPANLAERVRDIIQRELSRG